MLRQKNFSVWTIIFPSAQSAASGLPPPTNCELPFSERMLVLGPTMGGIQCRLHTELLPEERPCKI